MDTKTIELLEDLVVLMQFNVITREEKEKYKAKIKGLLDELA